jgi:hypothetical protein
MPTPKKKVSKKEIPFKVNEFKTRSPMYLKQMSDDVNAKLEEKSGQLNIAKWLIIETILENALGIDKKGIDLNKFLGVNANRARTGKLARGKATK